MARKDVTSREYKVMLRQERFVGDDAEVRAAIGRFLDDVRTAPARVDIPVEGEFDEVKARRLVRFFDTEQHELNAGRYIFRERVDRESRERQVTLKFRHPDRYVAQDRRWMRPTDPPRASSRKT